MDSDVPAVADLQRMMEEAMDAAIDLRHPNERDDDSSLQLLPQTDTLIKEAEHVVDKASPLSSTPREAVVNRQQISVHLSPSLAAQWRAVGADQNLTTDADIVAYLLQL
jgi:hypothetical protein